MPDIRQARILILATHGFEQSELVEPRDQLRNIGAEVDVATPDGLPIRGWNATDWGETVEADLKIGEARPEDYDALVLPGGVMNPDKLRTDDTAIDTVRNFIDTGKVVAAICHAPWLLVQADAIRGRDVTSYQSIRRDVENAGGLWMDRDVVADNGIVTSRGPQDIPAFVAKIVEEIQEGLHHRARAI
ncbi:protease [Labrys okinawensis]|uniref:Protease n=1 Tax=Labrys okinawensis TaxID=346911 RepID=A0A2S9QIW5_9HYPH|nr:type 1 glutamine amidotransferase domain-containing protein [Labrys okinawensis]PRH89299.1 protease [Labrys okinawensis]